MHFSCTDSESYSKDDLTLYAVDVFKTIYIILQFHILEKIPIFSYNIMSNSDNVIIILILII